MSNARKDRIEAALLGAYVGDAAALGFHWLYDPDRLAALTPERPEFHALDPADFEGFKGVFVHHTKRNGDLSHYGAQLRVMTQSLGASGGAFDLAQYQDHFASTFSAGGSWTGYIDKATKGTLSNLGADQRAPSGAEDDQLPAVSKLPALMALEGLSEEQIDDAITATNTLPAARAYGRAAAAVLRAAYDGKSVAEALEAGLATTPTEEAAALRNALDAAEADSTVFAGEVGRACPLPQSMPVIFHIAARADSYTDAIRRNIFAAGDNCGRGIILGALFGARFGIGGTGLPVSWICRLNEISEVSAEITALNAPDLYH